MHKYLLRTVPDTVVRVTIRERHGISLGEAGYTLECIVSETGEGLINTAVKQWLGPDGTPLVNGGGITVGNQMNVSSTITSLTVSFASVRSSHAGRYTCQARLASPALHSPLVKTAETNITVQSKHAKCGYIKNQLIITQISDN